MMNNENMSYFAYIMIGIRHYYIKDISNYQVVRSIITAKAGDKINVRGLGLLKIVNTIFHPHKDGEITVFEVGLVCNIEGDYL
jgi:hypothetical protein